MTGFKTFITDPMNEADDKFDMSDFMMAFEDDDVDAKHAIDGFAELIKSGIVWKLQGMYGKPATSLLDDARCRPKYRWFGWCRTVTSLIADGYISKSGKVLKYPKD